jgi:uncharacterized protein YecE (DUF72 family)
MSAPRYRTGCAVWAHKPWVGDLYPPGTRPTDFLRRYAERLTAVEGNTTFYSVPDTPMLERWRDATPETFRFCLKVPRDLTHDARLRGDAGERARAFVAHTATLGERRGPYFAQLPPDFGPDELPAIERFLDAWPDESRLAVEVRHPRWFDAGPADALNAALHRRGMGRVVMDPRALYDGADDPQTVTPNKKPNLPCFPYQTADFAFVRFVGHPDGEARNQSYLEQWAGQVAWWLERGVDVWFFAHCSVEARSPGIARAVHRQLVRQGAPAGLLPWDTAARTPTQLSLV